MSIFFAILEKTAHFLIGSNRKIHQVRQEVGSTTRNCYTLSISKPCCCLWTCWMFVYGAKYQFYKQFPKHLCNYKRSLLNIEPLQANYYSVLYSDIKQNEIHFKFCKIEYANIPILGNHVQHSSSDHPQRYIIYRCLQFSYRRHAMLCFFINGIFGMKLRLA